ncbi:18353_t:CDS:1, partial [Dentiscutata erythropus]
GEKIGKVISSEKQVVDSGSVHSSGIIYQFVKRGKVFLKFKDKEELANYLNSYRIVLEKESSSYELRENKK